MENTGQGAKGATAVEEQAKREPTDLERIRDQRAAAQAAADEEGFLSKDAILTMKDQRVEVVEIPEWPHPTTGKPGRVRVRNLTGAERDEFEARMVTQRGDNVQVNVRNVRARLVALTCVGPEGRPLFSEPEVAALQVKNAAALDRIYEVAARLSRITRKDVEELAGNSGDGLSAV